MNDTNGNGHAAGDALLSQLLGDGPAEQTLRELCDMYLAHADGKVAKRTLSGQRAILAQFCAEFGHKRPAQLKAADLQLWLDRQTQWKSAWTKLRAIGSIKRPLNWAVKMGLIDKNPFHPITGETGDCRRAMTEEEYLTLLRGTDAAFRRTLLFLHHTGCRPSELMKMRWQDVDLERGVVCLKEHKTAKKTKRPRIIPLIPVLVRMLLWMLKQRLGYQTYVDRLRAIVASRTVPSWEFHRQADDLKVPKGCHRSVIARDAGLYTWYEGSPGKPGHWVWAAQKPIHNYLITRHGRSGWYGYVQLANGQQFNRKMGEDRAEAEKHLAEWVAQLEAEAQKTAQPVTLPEPPTEDGPAVEQSRSELPLPADGIGAAHVFLTWRGTPWQRHTFTQKIKGLRRAAGLAEDVSAYGLRHLFGTQAIRNAVALKLVATAMGHADTRITERHYIHIEGEIELLRAAMEKATAQKQA